MKWNIPNQLTVFRVLLIPVLAFVFYIPDYWGYILATLCFFIASITDWFDGYLARKWNETSEFGRFLDPVADKLLVITTLVLLVEDQRVPAFLAVVIIGREIMVSALREWLAQRATVVHVSQLAKWKTAFQMLAIGGLLWHIDVLGVNMHMLGLILLWIAAVLTMWSAFEYLKVAWKEISR
ncbi:MAG: CDP-diacylglycerol--glycerol-3-phosphate 3-phosphatidyltransferase [Mariprofundaceae bacterium]|nr:CDP-diacylglycerol--glycerol-3-phosphate 3-phosphatidyltransferase [Mariprofundaceae bacterium]